MFALCISTPSSMISVLYYAIMSLVADCNQLSVKFGGRVISFRGGKLDLFGRDMVDGDCVGEGFFLLFKYNFVLSCQRDLSLSSFLHVANSSS